MRILGIDPGYERLGIAVIECGSKGIKDKLLFSECFKTSAKESTYVRLQKIGNRVEKVITEFKPHTLGIEKLFLTNNQKTAMVVAEARGVILYESQKAGLQIFEYTPPEIKVAITSSGNSDKSQIIAMVPRLIEIKKEITIDDEFDAIAIALTCRAIHVKS